MHDALSAMRVFYSQAAELFTPDTVIQQGSQDGPIPDSLERVRGRSFQYFPGLCVAERWRAASFPLAIGRFTLSTGLPVTALRSQR